MFISFRVHFLAICTIYETFQQTISYFVSHHLLRFDLESINCCKSISDTASANLRFWNSLAQSKIDCKMLRFPIWCKGIFHHNFGIFYVQNLRYHKISATIHGVLTWKGEVDRTFKKYSALHFSNHALFFHWLIKLWLSANLDRVRSLHQS